MEDQNLTLLPFAQFSIEMRSGKIIEFDDGFTSLLGYTGEDLEGGIVFKDIIPYMNYEDFVTELREHFIAKRYVSYKQTYVTKTGDNITTTAFYKIENKLLAGHRVVKVSAAIV